jgi:DNA adenine methylase
MQVKAVIVLALTPGAHAHFPPHFLKLHSTVSPSTPVDGDTAPTRTSMKPLLKWAGGKARLASTIDAAFAKPCKNTYFEPFLGAGALFLYRREAGKLLGDVVLSDRNAKLIETHIAIRDDVEGVLKALSYMPTLEYRDVYYEVREQFNTLEQVGNEHAARFLWLNRAGFNGLYRENKSGIYNVPVGRYKCVSLPSAEAFRTVSKALQGVTLLSESFETIIAQAGVGDQVYCDPPYVPLTATANFTAYCKAPFSHSHQLSLSASAREAAERGAVVLLSNHDTPIVREELYPVTAGFRVLHKLSVRRSISQNASKRGKASELLASIG